MKCEERMEGGQRVGIAMVAGQGLPGWRGRHEGSDMLSTPGLHCWPALLAALLVLLKRHLTIT